MSTTLNRNGRRQAHVSKPSPANLVVSLIAAVDRMRPRGTPICGQLAIRPRRLREPHSMDSSTEPPHSPPTPMPCATRSRVSRMGAAMPIVE